MMGIWSGRTPPKQTFNAEAVLLEEADCTELVRVVGESNYQDALRAICSSSKWEEVAFDCLAVLVPEPENPYDENAIMVQVDGQLLGYLSREDAVAYQGMVLGLVERGRYLACQARIAGRGPGSETSNLGVFLKLPPA